MGSKKYTIEEIQLKSDILHNKEYKFIGSYQDYDTPILTKHLICGHEWNMRLSGHFSSKKKGCPKCAGNYKLDSNSFQEKSNNAHSGEYLLISEYKSMDEHLILKHISCGKEFSVRGDNHLYNKTGCPKCKGGVKLEVLEIQDRLNEKYNNEYKIVKYNGHDYKSTVRHNCGKEYETYIHNLIKGKSICPCKGNTRWTQELFIEKSNEIHNNEYDLLSEFTNTSSKVLLKHNVCGYEWNISPKKHIFTKQGCPKCRKSQGEKEVERILISMNLKSIEQYKFRDCKNINELVFDFYLPDLKIAIEFDGIQHFESSEFFGGDKGFEKRKVNDEIKNRYCLDNDIKLIRISYIDNITEILESNLKLQKP